MSSVLAREERRLMAFDPHRLSLIVPHKSRWAGTLQACRPQGRGAVREAPSAIDPHRLSMGASGLAATKKWRKRNGRANSVEFVRRLNEAASSRASATV